MGRLTSSWIQITPESKAVEDRMTNTIYACYYTHVWALQKLQEIWMRELQIPRSSRLGPLLTQEIAETPYLRGAKRYALDCAVEGTVRYFHQNLVVEKRKGNESESEIESESESTGAEIQFPQPLPATEYNYFHIQARSVWKKYIFEHRRISTGYGTIFLEGNWREILENNAGEISVPLEFLILLTHSVTVRYALPSEPWVSGWEMQLNIHAPGSHRGNTTLRSLRKQSADPQTL